MRMVFILHQQVHGVEAKISIVLKISKVVLSYLLKMAILIKTQGMYLILPILQH